ncbi:MAG TPA: Abi-alpha family protein [Pseudonocardiaceae bacterium]|nr:Abi-alpha family protein [Pseudonocardiaceae bacterium]
MDGERAAAAGELIGRVAQSATSLVRTGWRVARVLPGGARAQRELLRLESALVDGVRGRLLLPPPAPATFVLPVDGRVEPLRAAMAALLNASANTNAAGAADHLYTTILRQLVPDEARILAVLADGQPRPSVDVVLRGPLGATLSGTQRFLLRNVSSIGRTAGVSAPAHVSTYLTRLYRLGVIDIADEDPALAEMYDILLTEPAVRSAEEAGRLVKRSAVKIVRHTVVISELGNRFWARCDPTVP